MIATPKNWELMTRLSHLPGNKCHRPAYRSQDGIGILEPVDDRRFEARA
jgi:hypothetical protein